MAQADVEAKDREEGGEGREGVGVSPRVNAKKALARSPTGDPEGHGIGSFG